MILKNNLAHFFNTLPSLDKVPQLGIHPTERQVLAIRPPWSGEGVGLLLVAQPSVRALFNCIASSAIWLELRKKEKEIIHNLLVLFFLRDRSIENVPLDFAFRLIRANLLKDRSSKAELSQRSQRFLGFLPTLAVAKNHVVVECRRLWFSEPTTIHPQRKRGYDDKGSLAPVGSISWQELALSIPSEISYSKASVFDISHFITGLRSRIFGSSDESQFKDENPSEKLIKEFTLCGSL
jgi:hypothetical protein